MKDQKRDEKPEILYGEIDCIDNGRRYITVYTPVHLEDKFGYSEEVVWLDRLHTHIDEYEKTGVQSAPDNSYIHLYHHLCEKNVSTSVKE